MIICHKTKTEKYIGFYKCFSLKPKQDEGSQGQELTNNRRCACRDVYTFHFPLSFLISGNSVFYFEKRGYKTWYLRMYFLISGLKQIICSLPTSLENKYETVSLLYLCKKPLKQDSSYCTVSDYFHEPVTIFQYKKTCIMWLSKCCGNCQIVN